MMFLLPVNYFAFIFFSKLSPIFLLSSKVVLIGILFEKNCLPTTYCLMFGISTKHSLLICDTWCYNVLSVHYIYLIRLLLVKEASNLFLILICNFLMILKTICEVLKLVFVLPCCETNQVCLILRSYLLFPRILLLFQVWQLYGLCHCYVDQSSSLTGTTMATQYCRWQWAPITLWCISQNGECLCQCSNVAQVDTGIFYSSNTIENVKNLVHAQSAEVCSNMKLHNWKNPIKSS